MKDNERSTRPLAWTVQERARAIHALERHLQEIAPVRRQEAAQRPSRKGVPTLGGGR